MEALKAIKIIGNQNDGRAVFYFFQILSPPRPKKRQILKFDAFLGVAPN